MHFVLAESRSMVDSFSLRTGFCGGPKYGTRCDDREPFSEPQNEQCGAGSARYDSRNHPVG